MIPTCRALLVLCCVLLANPARAQELPAVETDWADLRTHCLELIKNLETLKVPLPADTVAALNKLLAQKKPDEPQEVANAVQKLLDRHCLIGVNINPESRVKAARGPRKADLLLDRPVYVLVKVHNDGGVTHMLSADSPQKITSVKPKKGQDNDRWLELAVVNEKPFTNRLSGDKVEYRVLKLTARQVGKREATVAFDAGQGSQDLGFRAEVPILFTVRLR